MKRPNILLLLPDQHRGDWMPYDEETFDRLALPAIDLRMPTISSLMERGTTFTDCISPSPICAPARACLAFGSRYERCQVKDNTVNLPTDGETLYNVLNDAGYRVMGTGKFDVHKATKYWGRDGWVKELGELGFTRAIDNEGKFDAIIASVSHSAANPAGSIDGLIDLNAENTRGPYIHHLHTKGLAAYHVADFSRRLSNVYDIEFTELPEQDYCDNWITDNTIGLLAESHGTQPWFMQVNFTGPHDPWDITRAMYEGVKDRLLPPTQGGDRQKETLIQEIRKRYAAMIENIDGNIARILSFLATTGDLENTIVIYCSDHGEMLGDHGLFGKAVAYRPSVHVPLVIAGPGVRAGHFSAAMVELQDLSATIADLAGAHTAFPDSMSLHTLLTDGGESHRPYQYSALGRWRMVKDEHYKFVAGPTGPALYDITADPHELEDLADCHPALCARYMDTINDASGI